MTAATRPFRGLERRQRPGGAFGLAPLVDVVLLLLVFLLISARFDRSHIVTVDLPRVPSVTQGMPPSAEGRVIALAADGSLHWNGRPITRPKLSDLLGERSHEDRLLPLVIQGDSAAALGDGLALLEFLRGLGYPHCVFQVRGPVDRQGE